MPLLNKDTNGMKKYYVYVHLKADTLQPFYVGKGLGRRAWDKSHRSRFWKFIVAKHNRVVKLLHENLTEKEAFVLEATTIALFGKYNLCNFTNGGEIGPTGHKHSEESIKKMKGRIVSPETRKRMGDARRRWKFTEATKQKMSEVISGRTLTAEWKRKIGEAGCIPVETICGLKFKSAKLAAEWLQLNGHPKAEGSSIGKCCKEKLPRAYGYKWLYSPTHCVI